MGLLQVCSKQPVVALQICWEHEREGLLHGQPMTGSGVGRGVVAKCVAGSLWWRSRSDDCKKGGALIG